MLRIDDTDAMFLAVESGMGLQHVGGVCLLDVSAEGFSQERLARTLGERIAFVPRFRWKVRQTPLGLANPVWVEDESFDLQRHLKRVGVPSRAVLRSSASSSGSCTRNRWTGASPCGRCGSSREWPAVDSRPTTSRSTTA